MSSSGNKRMNQNINIPCSDVTSVKCGGRGRVEWIPLITQIYMQLQTVVRVMEMNIFGVYKKEI